MENVKNMKKKSDINNFKKINRKKNKNGDKYNKCQ